MPIGEQEWENASRAESLLQAAEEFLQDGYPKAYTPAEIVQETVPRNESSQQQSIVKQLIQEIDVLTAMGSVEVKKVVNDDEETTYYRAVKD